MRISRTFTSQPLAPGCTATLDEQRSQYLGRVLRLGTGDSLVLFNGDGTEYAGEIVRAGRLGMEVRVD